MINRVFPAGDGVVDGAGTATLWLGMLILLLYALPLMWRLGRDQVVWAYVLGALPAMSGTFTSFTRFESVAFPLFYAWGGFLSKPGRGGARAVVIVASAGIHLGLLWRFVNFRWAGLMRRLRADQAAWRGSVQAGGSRARCPGAVCLRLAFGECRGQSQAHVNTIMKRIFVLCLLAGWGSAVAAADWATYTPPADRANGKHVVLLAGDEEYRSEESLPMFGKLLSQRHGFRCTVLFSINPDDGTIDPVNQTNVPGMHLLGSADLVITAFRFRELPDQDMRHFVDYLQSGKPIIAIRTATHAFHYTRNPQSPFAKWTWTSKEWPGGFGQQVLGETWINHHGDHGTEATRGLIDGTHARHPVLRGVQDVFGPSDVYGVIHLKPSDTVLMHGLVLKGMKPDDPPNWQKSLMPLIWTRDYTWPNGKITRSLTTTIGAAVDFESEDLRRLMVNATYWLTGLEVPARADATPIGEFKPLYFGFGKFTKGVKPSDLELK